MLEVWSRSLLRCEVWPSVIRTVDMSNWRRFDHHVVEFGPGINFMVGDNASGKTSTLEAIAYALTGDPATVTRERVLRDPEQPATVRLSFLAGEEEYVIERTQLPDRVGPAALWKKTDKKKLASSPKGVTREVETIMGVSADFLRRIVYMAEGDVFKFATDPPGEVLDQQVRRVLGLDQIERYLSALDAAARDIRERGADLRTRLGELDQLGVRSSTDVQVHLESLDEQRDVILKSLGDFNNAISHLNETRGKLDSVSTSLAGLVDTGAALIEERSKLVGRSIVHIHEETEAQVKQLNEQAIASREDIARSEGERIGLQRVLDLLQPYKGKRETVPCPVCGKPMTTSEREGIVETVNIGIGEIEVRESTLKSELAEHNRITESWRSFFDTLRELVHNLESLGSVDVGPFMTISEIMESMPEYGASLDAEKASLEGDLAEIRPKLDKVEETRSAYLTAQNRLADLGLATPEAAVEATLNLETRALTLRAARQASNDTLSILRDVDMGAIYGQISALWNTFVREGRWNVSLGPDGAPVLRTESGAAFDLSQFSGGEKTALLVILHTIIAHHFSKANFLLLDEPLEHLDSINRRSLIRFLIQAKNRGLFGQIIISTFEESLIRASTSYEDVHAHYL